MRIGKFKWTISDSLSIYQLIGFKSSPAFHCYLRATLNSVQKWQCLAKLTDENLWDFKYNVTTHSGRILSWSNDHLRSTHCPIKTTRSTFTAHLAFRLILQSNCWQIFPNSLNRRRVLDKFAGLILRSNSLLISSLLQTRLCSWRNGYSLRIIPV